MENTFHMLLYRALHAQRSYLQPCLGRLGLGSGQPKLLCYLAGHGECSQRELADYFEIDPAAVSRMLDSLEKGGFVTRREDRSDRRTGCITLTQKGRSTSAAWQEYCREMEEKMLGGFTDKERQLFAGLLSRAYHNLKKQDRMGGEEP